MKRSTIALVAVFALIIGFSASWFIAQSRPVQLQVGTWFGDQARDLPSFELVEQNNRSFTRDSMLGNWHLLFFGYTHCPDICPISLQAMADMVAAIDDADVRKKLRIMFVSVDPDRDTPERLKSYVEYFNPEFIGATGSVADLNRVTGALGIGYTLERSSAEQVNYEVAHSAALVLINPAVQYAGIFGAPHNPEAIAQDLIKIIERY